MINVDIQRLAQNYPDQLSSDMHKFIRLRGPQNIADSADFSVGCKLERVTSIGAKTLINCGAVIGEGVSLGKSVIINGDTILSRNVNIGSYATIGCSNYFANGAQVPPRSIERTHDRMRMLEDRVTVGPGVILPSEVQIGAFAIIPSSQSIAEIGRFGRYARMVTTYGSEEGPKYSVGCQYGIGIDCFRDRISGSTQTEPESAQDYAKHIDEIEALGMHVQAAYDKDHHLVDELRQERAEAFAALAD